MLTKNDRDQLRKELRRDLRKDFEKIFVTKDEFNKFSLGISKSFDDVTELIKSIITEVKAEIRELRLEFRDGIEDHEQRITRLEEKVYEN